MLSSLLLIYLLGLVSADNGSTEKEIIPRCSDSPGTNMTFTPVEGYTERYIVELCTESKNIYKDWKLELAFYDNSDNCNASIPSEKQGKSYTHSINVEWVSSKHSCSSNQTVCISAVFDFIFSACYSICSTFDNNSAQPPLYGYFNIMNNHTEEEFKNNKAHVFSTDYKDYMSLTWYTGVPPLDYVVTLCNDLGNTSEERKEAVCHEVKNCSITEKTTIECFLNPPYSKYYAYLKHIAPWVQGVFLSQQYVHHEFSRVKPPEERVSGTGWGGWGWAGAGLCCALALTALAGSVACRSIAVRNKQKEVLRRWPILTRNAAAAACVENNRPYHKDVLLLYARECPAASRAIVALKAALQHVVDGQVYDIFDPLVMAECAAAPHAWMQRALRRRDAAVLLLQTPALHCLYAAQPHQHLVQLLSPLLGRRVVPRTPQFGDALLQYAIRITMETQTRDNYNKYYIATLPELPTEILPCVVPYRRYALPGATQLLLKDISSPSRDLPPQQLLDDFTQRLQEFVDYATDNPNYLMDELMVIDT